MPFSDFAYVRAELQKLTDFHRIEPCQPQPLKPSLPVAECCTFTKSSSFDCATHCNNQSKVSSEGATNAFSIAVRIISEAAILKVVVVVAAAAAAEKKATTKCMLFYALLVEDLRVPRCSRPNS